MYNGIEMKYGYAVGRPIILCRWWLKTRQCKLAHQIAGQGLAPVQEFYVPFWAWPLELLHRLIFGSSKIITGW
jgi:hypothetical protein